MPPSFTIPLGLAAACACTSLGQVQGPAVVVLDPAGVSALDISGSARLRVSGSGVHVNSTAAPSVRLAGGAALEAPYLNIAHAAVPDLTHFVGLLNTEQAPCPDPLLALPEPVPEAPVQTGRVTVGLGTTLTLGPGRGILFFQQRGNTAASSLGVSGTAAPVGTIYTPSAQLNITSAGGGAGLDALIVGRLNISGSGTLTVTACGAADFNGDGDTGTDQDIESFFRVLGGGSC